MSSFNGRPDPPSPLAPLFSSVREIIAQNRQFWDEMEEVMERENARADAVHQEFVEVQQELTAQFQATRDKVERLFRGELPAPGAPPTLRKPKVDPKG